MEVVVTTGYWSYKSCKALFKSSPPTNQYPVFYRPDALPVAQPTVSNNNNNNNNNNNMIGQKAHP